MKTQNKVKSLNLKEIEKLHPVERQKVLKEFLASEKNKELLKLINEEIRKAELEEETLEKLEDIPKKEKEKGSNLDNLVQRISENETEPQKKEITVSGKLYNVKEEEHQAYKVYNSYNPTSHEQPVKVEFTSTTEQNSLLKGEINSKFGEQNLSIESGIKKVTDLYKGKKKEEERNGH